MKVSLFLLAIGGISLSGCGVSETFDALEYNRQAVERSTQAIQENARAIEAANTKIEENRAELEQVTKTLKKAAES